MTAYEEFWDKYEQANGHGRYLEADQLMIVWDKAYDVLAERDSALEIDADIDTWNEARAKVALEILKEEV